MATLIGFGKNTWYRVNQIFWNDKAIEHGLKGFMSNQTDSDMSELLQMFFEDISQHALPRATRMAIHCWHQRRSQG